jgi:ParB family transcriptional regulator, chromosome partitioning protein
LSNAAEGQRRGLGRGFEVLIGGVGMPELAHVPIEQIHANPRQPRRRFDHEATLGLADSIRNEGVIQPVVLRPRLEGGYELIAGERRWRAAHEAGIPTVPAVIREADDRDTLLLGLVENVARENLSPVEEARGYALLLDEFELSLGDLSDRVGRSKPAISNKLRLLDLSDDVLAMVERGELTEGHARAVLAIPDQEQRRKFARKVVAQGMSVRAAERAARWAGARTKPRTKSPVDPALAQRVRRGLERLTGLEVRVAVGKVELAYDDEYDLEQMAEALERVLSAPPLTDPAT